MAAKRNAKGQFLKGSFFGRKRKATRKRRKAPRARTALVSVNKPRKRRKSTRRRARSNPPISVINETLGAGGAALLGGLAAHAALAVAGRIVTDPGVGQVLGILLPAALGIGATQFSHRRSQEFAAGAFGVAGAAVAGAISRAVIARSNPPQFWEWDNPPRIAGPTGLIPGALPSPWKSPLRAVS